jgi:phosphoribosyl-ATP pyrophosphohydrolase
MARVKPTEVRTGEAPGFIAQTKQYSFIKAQLDYLEKQQKELRAQLFEVLDESGEADSKGNIVIELPEEIDGYSSLIKQRRVTRKINEEAAEAIIAEHGLEETLYKTVRVIDEDALMAAL